MKKRILHNWQLKLFALLFAIIFWRIVGEVANPVISVTYRDIPITILNEEVVTDTGKVYQIVEGTTATVVVQATTSVQREISASDIIATADFEDIILEELVQIDAFIPGYENRYQEITVSPTNIILSIEDSISKKFPIVPVSIGSVNDGYSLGTLTAQTETVTIVGPESVVNSITKVVAQVNIAGLTSDELLPAEVICYNENYVEIDQSRLTLNYSPSGIVRVRVEVLDTKSVPLVLETSGEPEWGWYLASITAEPMEILLSGYEEDLEEIDEIVVSGSVLNVTGESGKLDRVIDIAEYIPEEVQLYDSNSNLIAVTIQIDEMGTKSVEIPVLSIVIYNNPEDYTVSYDGVSNAQLTFVGLEKELAELSASSINASIDLDDYTAAGVYSVPVMVTNDAGCELYEEVAVTITLTKKEG